MTLDIVKYTINYRLNIILICVFWICMLSLFILHDNSSILLYIKWVTLILIFVLIIHRQLIKSNTILGTCTMASTSDGVVYDINQGIKTKIQKLVFVYGGFKGKERGISLLLLPNSRFKDGTNNYLVINDICNIHILLKDKAEYQHLVDLLSNFQQSGIQVQKNHYVIFSIKRLYTFIRNAIKK